MQEILQTSEDADQGAASDAELQRWNKINRYYSA